MRLKRYYMASCVHVCVQTWLHWEKRKYRGKHVKSQELKDFRGPSLISHAQLLCLLSNFPSSVKCSTLHFLMEPVIFLDTQYYHSLLKHTS